MFVSRKDGKLYVRQNFAPLFDVPVTIAPSERMLGTHVFTAEVDKNDPNLLRWSVVSLPVTARNAAVKEEDERASRRRKVAGGAPAEAKPAPAPNSAAEALDRITVPPEAMARIAEALTTGGSIVVSDQGINHGRNRRRHRLHRSAALTRYNSFLSGAGSRGSAMLCGDESRARPAMIDRRTMMTATLAALAGIGSTRTANAQAGMSRITAYAFSFGGLAGGDIRLSEYAGRPLLIVNTASLCGFTPQYAGLQELWTEFSDRGLMIVGVPSNDFGGQEPGGATEIAADRAAPLRRDLPDIGQGRREGAERASVLQMGSGGAAEGCSALELPQIPDRPRRLYRRSLPGIGRPLGYAGENRHCAGAGAKCFRTKRLVGSLAAMRRNS